MIDKLDEKYCTGCFACMQKCPKGCITVGKDKDGFLRPEIDRDKCIGCDLCEKVCPQINAPVFNDCIAAYAMKSKEFIVNSTTAGIFAISASHILMNNGVVFGVRLTEKNKAETVYITQTDDLKYLQGSKYVQSYTGNCYKEAEAFLKDGRTVLFSGTPCQIAGLKQYLNKEYDNLYTIDLVCHGVPSQELFDSFWNYMEKKNNQKLSEWRFRAKEVEGWTQVDHLIFEKKHQYQNEYSNPYTYHFLKGSILRESCYNCQFSQKKRVGDITLGDYWGIQQFHPNFMSDEGVSLVLANTNQGTRLLDEIKDKVIMINSELKNMQLRNKGLVCKAERPPERDKIYEDYHRLPFEQFIKERLSIPFSLKRSLKSLLPYKLRKAMKQMIK